MLASKTAEKITCTRSLPSPGCPSSGQGPELIGVNAVLQNQNLWEKFAEKGTEMIITKVGRRMFPTLQMSVSGLEPDALYFILMDMVLAMDGRLKFHGGKWERAASDDRSRQLSSPPPTCNYVHPESPASGAHWMARPVSMQRAKMTNCATPPPHSNNSIALLSMHMYQPRIHVVKASDFMALALSPRATFVFPVTQFVSVTAYQNKQITKMKIDHNPFAKGFRDKEPTLRAKRNRAQTPVDSEESFQPPAKRSRSQQENSDSTASSPSNNEDSGVSSVGSASPNVVEVPEPRVQSLALPWEYLAWSAAARAVTQLAYPYHPYQQLWKYPYLLPPPPPLLYNPYVPAVAMPPPATTLH